jgi:hypothetical protein
MSQNNSYTSLTSTGHSAFAGDLSLDRSAVSDDGRGGVGVTNFAEQRKRKRQIDARVREYNRWALGIIWKLNLI